MLTKIKSLSNLITRKAVIAVGNGVLSARCKWWRHSLLTKWAQNVLKSLDRVKRRKTTAKKELTFPLEKVAQILNTMLMKKIILNFHQTPVGFTSPN